MHLSEIPHAYLLQWGGLWLPYAHRIADREGCDLSELVGEALSGEARIFVIWDRDGKPTGATATRLLWRNGKQPIGELHWLAGDGMNAWFSPCFQQLETILKRDHDVALLKSTIRPGLEPAFKAEGFQRVKIIVEKRLPDGKQGQNFVQHQFADACRSDPGE